MTTKELRESINALRAEQANLEKGDTEAKEFALQLSAIVVKMEQRRKAKELPLKSETIELMRQDEAANQAASPDLRRTPKRTNHPSA